MFEFPCPHCSVPLRLRDAGLRGRTIPCPDCGKPVIIREVNGVWHGETAGQPPSPPLPQSSSLPYPRSSWIPKAVAAAIGVALLLFILSGRSRRSPTTDPQPQTADNRSHRAEATNEHPDLPSDPAPPDAPEPPPVTVEARLRQIHRYISEHHAAHQMFPRGTVDSLRPASERFSWIAGLRHAHVPGTGSINPEQAWNDPANDDFVRRRFTEFENPGIEQIAGEDRYPASHFVGVTGVGADAAGLPKSHPRAGIFGDKRETTLADVTDGLANTMLVAGVDRQLGSWARGGNATMRAFTQEPYLHGPDGFGTGQPDGMFVLMADGSVRFLSAQTDPVIIRRMAAMADGLPLDSSVPGDPLAMTFRPPLPRIEIPKPSDDDGPPIDVPLAPDLPRFDLKRALQQKLVTYRQPQAVPFRSLLAELQELIGAPIDVSPLPESLQQREIQVDLENVTLAEVLEAVARAAGARVETERGRIQILPAGG